jgi:Ca-activated chloride channel homolog
VKGRHRPVASTGAQVLRVVAAAAAVLVVLGGSYYAYGKVSKPGCSTTTPITVAVAPEIASTLKAQATDWAADARVDGRCVSVDVVSADSADTAAAIAGQAKVSLSGVGLASGKTKIPDAWVPDSSAWLLRLRTAKAANVPATGTAVATSPIVVAMPEPIAAQVGWPQAKLTWPDLLKKVTTPGSQLKVGIVDPTRDTSGLAGLLSLGAAAQAAGPQTTETATAALRALVAGSSTVRQEILQRFPHATDAAALTSSLGAAPLSEQAVLSYNQGQPPVRLAALYVQPAPNPLDYPFVNLATAGKGAVAAAFGTSLTGAVFRDRLASAGLRAPDGSTGKGFQTPPGAPTALTRGAAVDGATVERSLQTWLAIALPARMLAVLDVSGSMLEKVPTAQNATRMQVTTEAARRGLSLFDDSWAVGLWIFSTQLDGNNDYKQLLPIGPLSAQRTQLLQDLATVAPKKNGDTGLYDTILAGYKAVQDGYDPGAVNTLMVMTDGQNDDQSGLTLDQLIAELKKVLDPKRPVNVILIGIGTSVGQAEMERITNSVGGGTFLAPDPAKIGEIFLKAVSLRTAPKPAN